MSLPTPYRLPLRERVAGDRDDFGNVEWTWVEREWAVHGIAPGVMDEPMMSNRDLSRIVYTVFGPKRDAPTTESAEIQVDGEWFPIDGKPKDWTRGPWEHPTAGVVVELTRVEG